MSRRPLRIHLLAMATPEPNALVTVANCYDLQEATRIRFALEAAGIANTLPVGWRAGRSTARSMRCSF